MTRKTLNKLSVIGWSQFFLVNCHFNVIGLTWCIMCEMLNMKTIITCLTTDP